MDISSPLSTSSPPRAKFAAWFRIVVWFSLVLFLVLGGIVFRQLRIQLKAPAAPSDDSQLLSAALAEIQHYQNQSYQQHQKLQLLQETLTAFVKQSVPLSVTNGSVTGRIAWNADRSRFWLVLTGLPPLAGDEVYQVWQIATDDQIEPVGTLSSFDQNLWLRSGVFNEHLMILSVTREVPTDVKRPTGVPVLEFVMRQP